jgi:glutamine-rich protein 1
MLLANTFVSLIDEDLLYDVHQLGILTPWSLLTTLLYTNSKYFNLKTVESHMAISFANFGKYSQWGRLGNNTQGQQMNYLRFYAHNPGKRRVFFILK